MIVSLPEQSEAIKQKAHEKFASHGLLLIRLAALRFLPHCYGKDTFR